ncbi:MAG: RNA polymerase sigma factor [Armatimonadota bacterium]
MLTDEQIVRRVRQGDLDAYGELVERYQRRLVAAAHHLVGDEDAARDVVQETFIQAYRHLEQLRDAAKVGAWLYGILRHRAHSWLAARRPTVSWEDESVDEWFVAADPAERVDMTALLAGLPAADRDALAARYLMDLSYDEVAKALGTSPQNARVRVCRAKERLRNLLDRAEKEVGL